MTTSEDDTVSNDTIIVTKPDPTFTDSYDATVTNTGFLYVRAQPSKDAKILNVKLQNADIVRVVGPVVDGYCPVIIDNGIKGYCAVDYLAAVPNK